MERALTSPLSAGLSSVKKSITGMFSSINSSVKGTLKLGASLATGVMVKRALDLQGIYRNISFTLAKLPGVAMSWEQVQGLINKSADETGQKSEAIADAFHAVVKATGNLSYSAASLDAIGTAATASGENTEHLAKAAELMNRKFNIGNKDIQSGLTAFLQLTGSGGKSLDELTGKFAVMAGEAAAAGMQGVPGLQQLLGLLINLDSTIGEKADPGLKAMFQTMKKGSVQLKRLQKEGRIKFDADDSGMDKIAKMLTTTKARAAAELVFTADSRQVFDTLAKPFDDAFKQAQSLGMSRAESVESGLKAFYENINKASQVTMTWNDVQQKATDRMAQDPSVKLRQAVEKVEQAFAKPKMISAIDTITEKLPVLAEKLAAAIEWIVDNPGTALATGVGLKIGGAAVGGAASTAIGNAIKKKAAAQAAAKAAAGGVGTAAAGGGASLLVPAAAVAGAGLAGAAGGYALHKYVFDPMSKAHNKKVADAGNLSNAAFNATSGGNLEEKMAVLQDVKNARANLGKGKYTTEYMAGSVASVFTDIESPAARLARTQQDLLEVQIRLLESIQKQKSAQSDSTDQVERFTRELGQAGDTLRTVIPGGGGPRGVNHIPSKPGADPVKG